MIVTLTANPSVDRTVELAGPLRRGAVQRALSVTSEPGGKGVNVARAVTAAGRLAVAVLPADHDDPVVLALRELMVPHRALPVHGRVRVNLTVAEADGTTTKINEPGVPLDRAVLDRLGEAVLREAAGARWAVLSGSLPPGVPAGWYAELVAALATSGARVAVDTSGAPLRALLESSRPDGAGLPDLLKPNAEELAELVAVLDAQEPAAASSPADRVVADLEADPAAAARAARRLVDRGVGAVLATLGSAGALLVTADGAWRATTAPVAARSTVGAGDSTLSGYLLADLAGVDAPGRLAHAVAYGAAAVQLPGSTVPTPADLREQLVTTTALAWEEAPAPAGSV